MKHSRVPEGNAPVGTIRPIVNYIKPDGKIGSVIVDDISSIEASEKGLSLAIAEARTLGTDLTIRFVARDTATSVSVWRVV